MCRYTSATDSLFAKSLEEENAALVSKNSYLETEVELSHASKSSLEKYKAQVESLEQKSSQQATEVYSCPMLTRHSLSLHPDRRSTFPARHYTESTRLD